MDDNSLGLIQRAYGRFAGGRMNAFSIVPIKGGPKWLRTDAYRIDAKADAPASPCRALQAEGPARSQRRPVCALAVEEATKLKRFTDGTCVPQPTTLRRPDSPSGQRYCKAKW